MMPILQQYDISQYEFEQFCENWVFEIYERSKNGHFNDGVDYDDFWEEFNDIKPSIWVKYSYTTSLGTTIEFKPVSNGKYETFFEFKIKQKKK